MNRNELMTSFRNADQMQHQNGWMMYEDLARDLGYFDMGGESKEAKQKDINYNYTKSYSVRNNNVGMMKDEIGTSETIGVRGPHKLPGAWFYEDVDEMSCSPISDIDEAANFVNLHASQEVRNVTQSVDVPSSEHVAEIVGRQGCKIKALRAKTNTYIKTPIRGEEPIFVVTGRPDDVAEAKYEIECAADHFTQIRASRKHTQSSGGSTQTAGHVTTYVRVPLRVVGLVVGPKGATIKRIQQDTHTYIITPSREREPIFEVTGMPSNVDIARKEIEQHIYQRTGNMPITDPPTALSQFSNGLPMNLNMHNGMIPPPFQNRLVPPQFGHQMPNSVPLKDYQSNDYSMRQMRNEMGFNSLLRSFPSMRSSLQNNQSWPPNTPSPTPTPSLKEKQINMMKLMQAVAAGNMDQHEMWSNNSLGEMIESDVCSPNADAFGRPSVWSSSLGFDGKTGDEKRDDSPINGLISLHGCGTGFGNLQSIWSDVRSSTSASLNSASASPSSSPSNCEHEKTLCVGANLNDILTV